MKINKKLKLIILFVLSLFSVSIFAKEIPEIMPGILKGYLSINNLPDSLKILPPPPDNNSLAFALDLEISRKSLSLYKTDRWKLAIKDANIYFPEAANTFSCALNIPINEKLTPHLYMLLRRSLTDAGLATYKAKKYYHRKRPFMFNGKPVCTPEIIEKLKKDGSYPSGHAAIGWAWALILAEISPENADKIFIRGWTFGQSRVICNVHWQSDVTMGKIIGSAVVAILHSNPEFLADLKAAKNEVKSLLKKGIKPSIDCSKESNILKIIPTSLPLPSNSDLPNLLGQDKK